MLLLRDRAALSEFMPKGGAVAEVGVQFGDHAALILRHNQPKRLVLVDCWERQTEGVYAADPTNDDRLGDAYRRVLDRFTNDSRVRVVRGYSLSVVSTFEDSSFDWVYLDGDHTLQSARADLRAWWPKVRPGGFLCGHDYILPEYSKTYSYIQVKEAVDEFLWELGLSLYALTDEKYGSWAIRKEP